MRSLSSNSVGTTLWTNLPNVAQKRLPPAGKIYLLFFFFFFRSKAVLQNKLVSLSCLCLAHPRHCPKTGSGVCGWMHLLPHLQKAPPSRFLLGPWISDERERASTVTDSPPPLPTWAVSGPVPEHDGPSRQRHVGTQGPWISVGAMCLNAFVHLHSRVVLAIPQVPALRLAA